LLHDNCHSDYFSLLKRAAMHRHQMVQLSTCQTTLLYLLKQALTITEDMQRRQQMRRELLPTGRSLQLAETAEVEQTARNSSPLSRASANYLAVLAALAAADSQQTEDWLVTVQHYRNLAAG